MKFYGVLLIAILCCPATAEVYKIVDEQGNTTYTDAPPAKNQAHEKVELKPINRQPPVEVQNRSRSSNATAAEEPVNFQVTLIAPAEGTQVPPGQRNLTVAAQVQPAMSDGHSLQFIMNGEPLNQPGSSTSWTIEEIYRGEHRISAQVLDPDGRVVATSAPVTVYVHRPTIRN